MSVICSHIYNFLKVSIPLWILPSSFSALSAGAFFIQFFVLGAWGVVRQFLRLINTPQNKANRGKRMQIPIYLAEISPPAYRATFPGVAYQLGIVRYTIPFFSLLK